MRCGPREVLCDDRSLLVQNKLEICSFNGTVLCAYIALTVLVVAILCRNEAPGILRQGLMSL